MGSSIARIRQILTIICLTIAFLLAVIIMGLVGVHGKVTFRTFNRGCLLYMSINGDVASYNNGYCLFPIVGSAVIAFLTLILLSYWILTFYRKDEYVPKPMSYTFLVITGLCGLLAFAICGEIGIGLNKGCQILGDQSPQCRSVLNFNALWGAEISAGLMGGFLMLAMLFELFQLRARPRPLGMDSDEYFANTNVVPNTRHNQVGVSSSNIYGKSPVVTSKTARVQKEEYSQPEMTSYPAHGSQYQQPYPAQQQPHPQQQQQQQYYQSPDQHYQPQGQHFQQAYTPQVYTPPPPLQPVTQTTETTTHVVENLPSGTDYH